MNKYPTVARALEEAADRTVMKAVLAIQADNCAHMLADPEGEYPCCKNALYTMICERCGRDVREPEGRKKACPAIPPEQRWTFRRP